MARSGKGSNLLPDPPDLHQSRQPDGVNQNRRVCASVAYIHPNLFPARLFQFADIQRTVVIQAGTVVLALVIANMTGNGGQGVALVDEFQRVSIAVFAKQPNVFRNILLDSAGSNTGAT